MLHHGFHFPFFGDLILPSHKYQFSLTLNEAKLHPINMFFMLSAFLCSNCSQKRASTKVIEAMFNSGVTEHSVLLWEGSVALTVVKRDEREGV